MITLDDVIGLCGLDPREVDAIAEHEHLPAVVAAALGTYLLHKDHGAERIRDMIVDDIRDATRRGDYPHARALIGALGHFVADHPECADRAA